MDIILSVFTLFFTVLIFLGLLGIVRVLDLLNHKIEELNDFIEQFIQMSFDDSSNTWELHDRKNSDPKPEIQDINELKRFFHISESEDEEDEDDDIDYWKKS